MKAKPGVTKPEPVFSHGDLVVLRISGGASGLTWWDNDGGNILPGIVVSSPSTAAKYIRVLRLSDNEVGGWYPARLKLVCSLRLGKEYEYGYQLGVAGGKAEHIHNKLKLSRLFYTHNDFVQGYTDGQGDFEFKKIKGSHNEKAVFRS